MTGIKYRSMIAKQAGETIAQFLSLIHILPFFVLSREKIRRFAFPGGKSYNTFIGSHKPPAGERSAGESPARCPVSGAEAVRRLAKQI